MKIAIRGHESRGKEVIQILKSLGGINLLGLIGDNINMYYYINDDNTIMSRLYGAKYKTYTLEEFEKEFPFKIGDKVITTSGIIGIIDEFKPKKDYPYCIRADDGILYWRITSTLKPYKEMNEERNITLTLEKAKEWYKKGGELKEIALQAFTEKELNPLPRSWEEYCRKYEFCCFSTRYTNIPLKYDALLKLEQLRDCWRQGWKPDWLNGNTMKYAIKGWRDKSSIETTYVTHAFLSFPTYELALEFQECFRDLIEQAGDLI